MNALISVDPVATLTRLLGAVETHSITTEAAAERGDLQRLEVYSTDCREAHDRLVMAAAAVIAAHPRTTESAAARDSIRKAGDLLANAMVSVLKAWAKRGGNQRTITLTTVHREGMLEDAAQ